MEYLETLPEAVIVIDPEGRVLGANRRIAALLGRGPADLRGTLPGQAFACVWSRPPEGCGNAVHCRECTMRRRLDHVRRTGEPLHGVSAWVLTDGGRLDVAVSPTPEEGLVTVVVGRPGS